MNAQEVLRSIVEQIKDKEGLQGLIILDARYGQLTSTINENSIKIIDVTVPLQALVKDSTLKIGTTVSKSNLTGFYDPCIGEEKNLFIKYSFRSQIHTVLYKDTDPVRDGRVAVSHRTAPPRRRGGAETWRGGAVAVRCKISRFPRLLTILNFLTFFLEYFFFYLEILSLCAGWLIIITQP